MNVNYNDGRREVLTGLTPEQVADHARRVTSDPAFESAEVKQMFYEMNGETNRHARRKWAAQQRKKGTTRGK